MNTIAKYLLVILIITSAYACNKNSDTAQTLLTGKWKLTQLYASTGPPGQWVPAINNSYVIFYSNGVMGGSVFPNFTSFSIKDSVTLVLFKNDQSSYSFRYSLKNKVLEIDPPCIEGCGIRLSQVSY